ncbi:hypothetical protein VULLAG_LOCUS20951 [Vulpes lagopus]|uniref:uncharacterized protein LOC121499439 isoform X1 n=1 Tax=Vulpes lagopus TaxID=494514 RepID=UPI001BCA16F4|nr:uncharacterized protein LOC121499439 isoform X1 [Vulpes lagopus]
MEACGFLLHFGSRKGNSLLKWHLLLGRLASGCSAPAELREGGGAGNITSPPHPRSLQNRTLRHWGDLHAASLPPAVTEAILHPHETVATSVSPSVGPGPVAAAAPENWLEMHVLGPIPDELHQKLANLWARGPRCHYKSLRLMKTGKAGFQEASGICLERVSFANWISRLSMLCLTLWPSSEAATHLALATDPISSQPLGPAKGRHSHSS